METVEIINRKECSYSEKPNSSDTISRRAAIDALRMDIDIIPFAKAREYARAVIETVHNRLEELPSAQPEIIRCKDCRYYKTYQYVNGIRKFLPKCSFNDIYVAEEDFCSQAERRTDEQTD